MVCPSLHCQLIGAQLKGLDPPDFRTLPVLIARQNKLSTYAAACDKRFKQQSRKLNRGSIGAFRNHLVHATPVVLEIFLRGKVDAEFKEVHARDAKAIAVDE
jgi:hypothetical protein